MLRRSRCLVAGFVLLASVLFEMPGAVLAQRAKEQPPVLTMFVINRGADTISASEPTIALTHTVVGTRPSEYRVSHRADFAGARWQPYTPVLSARDWHDDGGPACDSTRLSHRVTLYLQVRATLGDEVRVVDGQRQLVPARVESNVLRATVCAHGGGKVPREHHGSNVDPPAADRLTDGATRSYSIGS